MEKLNIPIKLRPRKTQQIKKQYYHFFKQFSKDLELF
jgi:hypothetical protein